jgi:hypothetical protein
MGRVKFNENNQRKFIESVLTKINAPSLRGLLQFGFDIPYSTLKNYYCGRRLLPESFFRDLCHLAELNISEIEVEFLKDNWGFVKGGKISRRGKI